MAIQRHLSECPSISCYKIQIKDSPYLASRQPWLKTKNGMLNGPASFSRFIQPRFEHLPRIGLKAYDTIHGIDIQITSNKVLKRTGKLLFELQGTEH